MHSFKYVSLTIILDEFSRVILKRLDSKHLDYINANYVNFGDHKYIITQGPLPSTIGDFFTMLNQ
jgi:protein tyrosine phosphatase